jgi:hypothetical protein
MNDKALHMIAGLIISLVIGWIYSPLIGLAVAIVAGIAKEVWDSCGHGTPDFKDALTTAEGGVIGCIILAVYQAV